MWLGDREFFAGGDVESLKSGDVFFVDEVFGGEIYGSCSVDGSAEDGGLGGVGGGPGEGMEFISETYSRKF